MPTIREIAEACNVSKPTVTVKLKELDLWDTHVSKVGKTFEVTDEAASIIAAELVEPVEQTRHPVVFQSQDKMQPDSSYEGIYKEYIDSLKAENARLWSQIHEKDEQLRDKDELIADLSRKLAENQPRPSFWSRLLPSGKDK